MLQLSGRTSSDCDNGVSSCTPDCSTNFLQPLAQTGGPVLRAPTESQQASASFPREHGAGVMVHWKAAFPQQQIQSPAKGSAHQSEDEDHCPFTPPPPRERLSYTRHQLELLNGIYQEVRYPNSTQKQLIAKRVGITREQVKIWFQNRRRKDVVTKTGKNKSVSREEGGLSSAGITPTGSQTSSSESCNETKEVQKEDTSRCGDAGDAAPSLVHSRGPGSPNGDGLDFDNESCNGYSNKGSSCIDNINVLGTNPAPTPPVPYAPSSNLVSPTILRGMIAELNKFDNEYLKLKKGKKKKNKSKFSRHAPPPSSTLAPCKSERMFQDYDMVAPPNKVTPSAFLNTSVNKFKHAVGTSAFHSLRENRLPGTNNDSPQWDGFAVSPPAPGIMDAAELLQPRSSSDILHPSFRSTLNFPTPTQYSSFLSGRDGVSVPHSSQPPGCEHLPVLSDLLANYKNHHHPCATAIAAAAVAAAQRQQEHSLLSSVSSGQAHPGTNMSGAYFNLPVGSNTSSNMTADSDNTLINDMAFSRSASLGLFPQSQASSLAMNRVFPFPLVADPPVMLSSSRQSETLLNYTHWHHPGSSIISQTSLKGSAHDNHSNPTTAPVSVSEDHYRPLVISSVSNPYFTPSSSTYPLPSSSLPSQSQLWSL